jgi:hypothetical protein
MPIDYGRLVNRTWEIFSRNRVLWILGLIAALTSGGNSSSSFNFNQGTGTSGGTLPDFNLFLEQWGGLIFCLACGLFILAIILTFVNAAAEAGMIATVDQIERTREQPAFGAAWSMGTRKMVPVWLVNLAIGLITLVLVLILFVPILLFFVPVAVSSTGGGDEAVAGGILFACLCVCALVILLIPLIIALGLVQQLALRAVVLDNQGVFEAIGTGWRLLNEHRGPTLVTWLITLVVGFVEGFASVIVLLPVGLIFLLPAMGALMNPEDFTFSDFPWPLLIIGIILLWLLAGLIGALFRAFTSTLWTLFYRNRRQMPGSELAPAGMLPPVGPGGAPYGGPYGPAPGGAYGTPPSYPPAQGAPPPYTPPPYTPPPADTTSMGYTPPPADTTNMGYTPPPTGPGGVQYGSPYSPPTTPMPPLGAPPPPVPGEPPPPAPDDRARGPEGDRGPV